MNEALCHHTAFKLRTREAQHRRRCLSRAGRTASLPSPSFSQCPIITSGRTVYPFLSGYARVSRRQHSARGNFPEVRRRAFRKYGPAGDFPERGMAHGWRFQKSATVVIKILHNLWDFQGIYHNWCCFLEISYHNSCTFLESPQWTPE